MNTTKRFQQKTLATAVAAATLLTGHSLSVSAADGPLMEEVVVTASARKQSVQDIPYNISAVQGADITAQGIVDQSDLMRSIAGITVIDRGYRNSGTVNSIIIRGMNVDNGINGDVALSAVPTVSTYVDNTPLFANFLLKDIQRVEVLRGPQGTLYGSGALAGAVRYITNKPNPEQFEGNVSAGFSQTDGSDGDNWTVDAVINIPISEKAAVRISTGMVDNDGIIDYVNAYQMSPNGDPMVNTLPTTENPLLSNTGTCVTPEEATNDQRVNNGSCYRNVKDADWVEIEYVKAALLFEPSDSLSILASYHTQSDETGGRRAQTPGADYFGNAYDDHELGATLLEPSERDVELFSLDVEADLGFATLTSNTSNYEHDGEGDSDNNGLWVSGGNQWFENYYPGMPRPAALANRYYDDSALVQEFRLVSNETVSGIDWLVGAYYMDQERDVGQWSYQLGLQEYADGCDALGTCPPSWYYGLDLAETDFEYLREEEFTDMAVYGEMTLHISDVFRITGGVRWFDNELKNQSKLGFPLWEGASEALPTVEQETFEDDDVLFKFNASYDLNETQMLYGTFSQGYRRGGSNAIPAADAPAFAEYGADNIQTYDADYVDNYEFGLKGKTDNFAYTISAFYMDWQDPQLNTVSTTFGFFTAINGESAATQGIELELEGYLTESLHFNAGYTYVDAELTDDVRNPQYDAGAPSWYPEFVAMDGATLPGTSESVISVGLDHTLSLSTDMDLVSRISGYYQSESQNYISEDSKFSDEFDSFSIWNASATLVADNWTAQLYVKNLTNEEGITGSFPESYFGTDTNLFENWYGNGARDMISQPRTIGMNVNYKF